MLLPFLMRLSWNPTQKMVKRLRLSTQLLPEACNELRVIVVADLLFGYHKMRPFTDFRVLNTDLVGIKRLTPFCHENRRGMQQLF